MIVLFKSIQKIISMISVTERSRIVVVHLSVALTCLLALGFGVEAGAAASAESVSIVPSRQVEQLQQEVPEWKRLWDTARRMVLAGDYPAAVAEYKVLLTQRPGLEEGRWELAKTYVHMQDWPQAVALLERLIDGNPNRLDYLNALADVMARQKHEGRAVELFGRVLEKSPDDNVATEGMARGLLSLDRPKEALVYFQRAYLQNPVNNECRRTLADLAYGLGEYELARPHLVALASAPAAPTELLLKAARLHEKLGLQNLAVDYWQRLLKRKAHKLEAHRRLALIFENSGLYGKALPHLMALNREAPNDPSLSLRIGKALAVTSRGKEALPYLDRYVAATPDDIDALELLVGLYATQGEKEVAAAHLDRFFAVKEPPVAGRVKQAARLYEAAGRFEEAVVAYRRYLSLAGNDPVAVQSLAANLRKLGVQGNFEALARFADDKPPSSVIEPEKYKLMIASAFAGGGLWGRAVVEYEALLSGGAPDISREALLGLSDIYRQMGLLYESEQSLRQALILGSDSGPVLLRLFELALFSGNDDDAEVWQQRLALLENGAMPSWRVQLCYSRLLAARGDYWLAIRNCGRVLINGTGVSQPEVRELLAGYYMALGDYSVARRQLEQNLKGAHSPSLNTLVLLQQVYAKVGLPKKAEEVFLAALSEADRNEEGLLLLADLYRGQGMIEPMVKVAALCGQRMPDSPRVVLLEAEAYRLSGQDGKAEEALQRIAALYHGESGAAVRLLQVYYGEGRFADVLALLKGMGEVSSGRPDVMLLKARSLWALNQFSEALEVYQSFLMPSVAEQLGSEMKKEGVSFPPLVSDPTFWQIITLRGEEPAGFIDIVMEAGHLADFADDSRRGRLNNIAVKYYARYRWYKRLFKEFAAKRAVKRKEYLFAERQYQAALRDDPRSPSLLFGLAGVYSRLGWLGEEAAIYDQLAAQRVEFPGLAEARQRNRLKRRPLTTASYGYQEEDGRDGYKDIRREWQSVSMHFSPMALSRQEMDLSLSRRRYRPVQGNSSIRANRALFSYSAGLTSWLSGRLAAGVESPLEDNLSSTGILQGALNFKIGDKVTAGFSYDRDVVSDTMASLTRKVLRETIKGSTSLALLPRLQVGADCSYIEFSDANETKGYDFWASYQLLTEPNSLQVQYLYDFKDSREGQIAGVPGSDGFAATDHPYWSPMNYWFSRFAVSYRRQLSDEILDRGGPTYYTADYSIDYDSMGRHLQTFGGSFLHEWSDHYLVKAAASLTTSDLYRSKDISLSLVYRW
ncbi:MAG: tetratricopeptide repeat protein [Desulfobulbaceae bacterium]|nr:tetratricopeptide repeat protein [Desulfobulbaceae bacterium]